MHLSCKFLNAIHKKISQMCINTLSRYFLVTIQGKKRIKNLSITIIKSSDSQWTQELILKNLNTFIRKEIDRYTFNVLWSLS